MGKSLATLERMTLPSDPRKLTVSALIAEAAAAGDTEQILASLTPAQLSALGRAALADELKDAIRKKIKTARIDYKTEAEAWLSCYSSRATQATYRRALDTLSTWCTMQGVDPLAMTPEQADAWLQYETRAGSDADTVRVRAAAVSSFFTFSERRHPDAIRNPIRGTKARPRRTAPRAEIPTPAEIKTLADYARGREDYELHAAVIFLSVTGCRVGALPELTIRPDGSYTTTSKGKAILARDPLPPAVLDILAPLGSRPFARYQGRKIEALKWRFSDAVAKLHEAGKLAAKYSPHDLRHAYAEQHKDRGLYWLKDALGHSSVAITETYLRNTLGIDPRANEEKTRGR